MKLTQREVYIFLTTAMRTSERAKKLPSFMYQGLMEHLTKQYCPDLKQTEMQFLESEVQESLDNMMKDMFKGFMQSRSGKGFNFSSIIGAMGLGKKEADDLNKQMEGVSSKSSIPTDKASLKKLDDMIRRGMEDDDEQ